MPKRDLKTIKDLRDLVRAGAIDEAELTITLDNDRTMFRVGADEDIEVKEANGCYDVDTLYRLLFPRATVEWC